MSNSSLKIIAIISMFFDHAGIIFFPDLIIFRIIGRIGFPIFVFLLIEGCNYTKNYKKHIFNLGLFALISEMPYKIAFNSNNTNVFFTLLLGALMIYFIKLYKNKVNTNNITVGITLCLLFSIISLLLRTDYSGIGIILIYLIYQFKYIGLIVGCLLLGFINPISFYSLLSLIPIYFYNKKRGINLKYIFYIIYPLHLIIFYLLGEL